MEKKYQNEYLSSSLPQNLLVAKITILIFLTYAPIIFFVLTKNEFTLLLIISLISISGAVSLIVLSAEAFFQKHRQLTLFLAAFIVALGPNLLYLLTDNNRALFQVDILLPIIAIFTMYGIGFALSLFTNVVIIITFILLALLLQLDSFDFFSAVYVLLSGGIVTGVAAYFMDRAHRRLFLAKQESDEFKSIVEYAKDSITIYEIETMRYLYANKVARENSGKTFGKMVGEKLVDIHPEFTDDVMNNIIHRLDQEGSFSEVYKLYNHVINNDYYVHAVIQYGYFNHRKVIIAFSSDATAQKETEVKLEEMALRDALTGLYNRHKFDDSLKEHIALSYRYKQPLSLILCDVDHFKKINDLHGHLEGDQVLQTLATLIKDVVRESDIVARWGGEEFIILLPNTNLADAIGVAEKIRQHIEAHFRHNIYAVTVSCGVSEFQKNETQLHWFNRVDTMLYKAKDLGRNRVCST